MKKNKYWLLVFASSIVLMLLLNSSSYAHTPPVSGATDCGLIQGTVFYSNYYSPPDGTPVTNGSCSWIKQGTASCGTGSYGGTNYTLYTYKFICNVPLDEELLVLALAVSGLAVFKLRKRSHIDFSL